MAADRVMKSVTSWLERKLFLKVSATKTKVVRPPESHFLGFTFWKSKDGWKCKPADDRKKKLYAKVKEVLKRKHAVSRPLSVTFTKLNQIIRGWINYFKIGSMRQNLKRIDERLRTRMRIVIWKQWKIREKRYWGLRKLGAPEWMARQSVGFGDHYQAVAKTTGLHLINKEILAKRGLLCCLDYYLN